MKLVDFERLRKALLILFNACSYKPSCASNPAIKAKIDGFSRSLLVRKAFNKISRSCACSGAIPAKICSRSAVGSIFKILSNVFAANSYSWVFRAICDK